MIFNNGKPIYVQMAERLCDEIVSGIYGPNSRIPSVREYAVTLEVNTNTAVKAYDLLARENIIYNKRGLGYFVSAQAKEAIITARKKNFLEGTLPELFRQMKLLNIDIRDIEDEWIKRKNDF